MRRACSLVLVLSACSFGGGSIGPAATTADGSGDDAAGTTGGGDAGVLTVAGGTAAQDTGIGEDGDTTSAQGSVGETQADTSADADSTGTPSPTDSTGEQLPDGLIETNLLVRYFLDEQGMGPAPDGGFVLDSGPGPKVDLQLVVAGGQPDYAQKAGQRGLEWTNPSNAGRPVAPVVGTKLNALNGGSEVTIQWVSEADTVSSNGSRLVHIGALETEQSIAIASRSLDELEFRTHYDNRTAVFEVAQDQGRAVYTFIADLSELEGGDPFLLFVDNVPQLPTNTNKPPANATLQVDPDHLLSLGNRDDGGRALGGVLYYAAIYDRALSVAEVEHNVAILLADDDEP